MHVLIPVSTLTGILSGFIITQLFVQNGLEPGLKAFLVCSSLVICCGVAGNLMGKFAQFILRRPLV